MVLLKARARNYKFPSLVVFLEEPLKFEPKLQNSNEFFSVLFQISLLLLKKYI